MKNIRRKEKAIESIDEIKKIIKTAQYITLAMCKNNYPYLVTLSHGYDQENNVIYFHCASKGKKIDILSTNNTIWGQALIDMGYVQEACDHLYKTAQFKGKVSFIKDPKEKRHALTNMINKLDKNPQVVIEKQLIEKSIRRVTIGRIKIDYMSGKESKKAVISL
jgi:nitroimidazol reductase NimA-like FMN-containing flavoprotein (pyridoxamine 5'-phosphate oxidase superfamily)